jgi:hypothetical protein
MVRGAVFFLAGFGVFASAVAPPASALRSAPSFAVVGGSAVASSGTVINVVNPAIEALWRDHRTSVNVHLIWGGLVAKSSDRALRRSRAVGEDISMNLAKSRPRAYKYADVAYRPGGVCPPHDINNSAR